MEDIFVGRLMSTQVVTVSPETPVEEAAERLLSENIGSLVVVDDDSQIAGILTSTDFVRVVAEGEPSDETTVADHMSQNVATATAQDDIQDAADKLITYDIHHLPVVDDHEGVIGMLSTTDMAAYVSAVQKPTPS
jgi:CBS domain-containing protein